LKGKRVEYQKYLRIKFEQEDYQERFGLSDNIELEAEADFVLQREFRIDFVFIKIEKTIPLAGIFSYFKMYNLVEFKSVNDAFDLVQLRKYLGELFWWLYTKDDGQLQEDEVTLTIITVRKPNKVLKHLEQPHMQIDLKKSPGHYRWTVMGVSVHLLVVNELDIIPEHYAWLSLAEGRKYEAYREQLAEDISQDEKYQIYLDILSELEEEGKERMADEVIRKIIGRMTPERVEKLLLDLPAEQLQKALMTFPTEQLQQILVGLPAEQLRRALVAASGK